MSARKRQRITLVSRSTTQTLPVADRVAAGIAWFDANRPGWERRMNLAMLNMRSGCWCVAGQVLQDEAMAAGYNSRRYVGIGETRANAFAFAADRLGLDIHELGFASNSNEEYDELEEAWRDAIKARFDSGMLSDGPA